MVKKWTLTALLLFAIISAFGQNPVLEKYIQEGLQSNLALKQLQLDYSKSMAALREARGYFYPQISVNARYTVADGGRVISFPVGDLLNPVYNTLNQLTTNRFPEVENQEFSFYRPKEHETKITLIQPLYNSDLIHNVKIRKDYTDLAGVDADQYRRELIREIKKAYHNYLKAFYMESLADSTMVLVKENLRVNRSLFRNDLVTIDAVYRSEAEVSKVEAESARAAGMMKSAAAWFNFLLNRPLDSEIEISNEPVPGVLISLGDMQASALRDREELEMIREYISLNTHRLKLEKGAATPDLFGTVDYGFQGEVYSFTNEDDFVLASLVLRWQLFQGFSTRNKIQQSRIEGEKLENALEEAEQRIRLQVIADYNAVHAANKALQAAEQQLISARKAFSMIDRKYRENKATLLEFIDARTSFTAAQSNRIICRNEFFIKMADLEYSSASLDTEKYNLLK